MLAHVKNCICIILTANPTRLAILSIITVPMELGLCSGCEVDFKPIYSTDVAGKASMNLALAKALKHKTVLPLNTFESVL